MGDRTSFVGVQPHGGEVPDDDGLEVHHQVLAERGVIQPREKEEARGLDGTARHNDHVGLSRVGGSVPVDELDPGGPPALGDDATHVGLGHQLRPPCRHRPGEQRHRIPLGVDGAAEEGAEPAVVAGRPAVVGDAVRRRRCLIGVQAHLLGRGRRQHRPVHGRAGRHRVGTRPPGGKRIGPLAPGHPDRPLDLCVIGLELVVVEGPVADGGVFLRPVGRRGGRNPPHGTVAPSRRHVSLPRRQWWGWSSPRRRACARPRPLSGGRRAARRAGPARESNATRT